MYFSCKKFAKIFEHTAALKVMTTYLKNIEAYFNGTECLFSCVSAKETLFCFCINKVIFVGKLIKLLIIGAGISNLLQFVFCFMLIFMSALTTLVMKL